MVVHLPHRYCFCRIGVFDVDVVAVIGVTVKDCFRLSVRSSQSLIPAFFKDLRTKDGGGLPSAAVNQFLDCVQIIGVRGHGKPFIDDQELGLSIEYSA